MSSTITWPTLRELYLALGPPQQAFSRIASGHILPDEALACSLLDVIRGHDLDDDLEDTVRDLIGVAVGSPDASRIWSNDCPPITDDAELRIDKIDLGLRVSHRQRSDFARLAQQDAFPGRNDGFYTTWRSSSARKLGHVLRVSHRPRFPTTDCYALISCAPPLIFSPAPWRVPFDERLARKARARIRALLAMASLVHVRRVDVALDVRMPLWALQAVCVRARRTHVYREQGAASTVQSGVRRSWLSATTYDKRGQLKRQHAHELDHELTRVEVRLRTDLLLRDLASLSNPFEQHVSLHRLEPARSSPAGLKMMVRLARLIGVTELRRLLSRKLYDGVLASTELDAALWHAHPRNLFERRWPSLARRLASDLEV